MSRSKLRNKWMRKQYAKPIWSYMRRNMQDSDRNPHRLDEVPKNTPSRYITEHCSADVNWLQESTSFGGHSIPKGGHRRVSGLVRASVKEEVRKQIDSELENLVIPDSEEANRNIDKAAIGVLPFVENLSGDSPTSNISYGRRWCRYKRIFK